MCLLTDMDQPLGAAVGNALEILEALERVDPEARSASHSDSSANPLDRLARGCKVLYFAGYKKLSDRYKIDEIEAAADQIIWCCDEAQLTPGRAQDKSFHGNIVQAMLAYARGELGDTPIAMHDIAHIIAIGSDRMMAAVAAARAGADVTMVAAVGDDAGGRALLDHLSASGVDVGAVVTLPVPSGTAAVLVGRSAENMIVVAPGANAHLTMDSARVRDVVAAADVLLVQLEIPIATAVAAAREARSVGATVIVNASPASPDAAGLAELAAVTDVVVVNEAEAAHWGHKTPHRVVTRGSRGACYRGVDGDFDMPAPEVEPIDTTGAGDVFAGVLAAHWAGGGRRALRRAAAAGALATLVPGAGGCAPSAEAVDDVLGANRIA